MPVHRAPVGDEEEPLDALLARLRREGELIVSVTPVGVEWVVVTVPKRGAETRGAMKWFEGDLVEKALRETRP